MRVAAFLLAAFAGIASGFMIPSAPAAAGRARGVMSMVKVGDVAPDFQLKDQNGKLVKLSSFKGKKEVVCFFYPADDTPGCTKEAKAFNAALADFKAKGAEVFGISRDEDHKKFIEKYGFQLTLLSDVGGAVRKLYNVPASLFGALDGRVTYVIGKDGKIKLVYDNQFAPETHVEKSLSCLL